MYNKPILVILRNKTVLQASIVKFVLLSATRIMLFLSKLSHISYGNQESLLVYSTSMCRWHANPKAKFWDDCLVMFTHWDRIWILVLSCVKRFERMTHYQIFYFLGKQILKLTKFSNNSFVGTVFLFCSLYRAREIWGFGSICHGVECNVIFLFLFWTVLLVTEEVHRLDAEELRVQADGGGVNILCTHYQLIQ